MPQKPPPAEPHHHHHHHHELDRIVREFVTILARIAQEIPMSALTDRVTASVTAALPLIGGAGSDNASITRDMDRLDAAVAQAGAPTGLEFIDAIVSFTGTGPFTLTVNNGARFTAGQRLNSAPTAVGPLDQGSFTVDAITGAPNTVVVSTVNGWVPTAGHVIGVAGQPPVKQPAPVSSRRV